MFLYPGLAFFYQLQPQRGNGGGDRYAGWQLFLRLCRILLSIAAAGLLPAADLSDPAAAAEFIRVVSNDRGLNVLLASLATGTAFAQGSGRGGRGHPDLPLLAVGLDVDRYGNSSSVM